jgi:HK97 family phage portal protein|tara:strand:- start:1295 stop:2668 length:1374 start_codon:yes stop_codon:yes gene_type:complete
VTILETAYRNFLQATFPTEKANTERPPQSLASGTTLTGIGGGIGTPNQLAQMQSMVNTSWLFSVVDRIASSAAAVPWGLFQSLPNGEARKVTKHPVLDLWESVNPFYTRHEFIETSLQHFELTGEIWWLIVRNKSGKPVELWNIRPDRIRPVPHTSEFVAGYIYTIGQTQIPLERKDVIFIRRPSPIDPYRGIGTVQSMMVDIGAEQMAAQWTRNFFSNGAMPGGILQFDEGMSDQDFERLVTRWSQQHQGVANAHRVAVLERGKWVDRKFTQREMQMNDMRRINRDIIFGAFGIPSSVMGVTESVNRANAEAGDVLFGRWILRPRLERIKQAMNERLVRLIDKSLFLDYTDPAPENRELHLNIAEKGYAGGLLTRNESRALLGYGEAAEGGDEYSSAPSTDGAGLIGLGYQQLVEKAASDIRDQEINDEEDQMETKWEIRLRNERNNLIQYLEEVS